MVSSICRDIHPFARLCLKEGLNSSTRDLQNSFHSQAAMQICEQKKVILEIFTKIIPTDLLVYEYKHWHVASVGQIFL